MSDSVPLINFSMDESTIQSSSQPVNKMDNLMEFSFDLMENSLDSKKSLTNDSSFTLKEKANQVINDVIGQVELNNQELSPKFEDKENICPLNVSINKNDSIRSRKDLSFELFEAKLNNEIKHVKDQSLNERSILKEINVDANTNDHSNVCDLETSKINQDSTIQNETENNGSMNETSDKGQADDSDSNLSFNFSNLQHFKQPNLDLDVCTIEITESITNFLQKQEQDDQTNFTIDIDSNALLKRVLNDDENDDDKVVYCGNVSSADLINQATFNYNHLFEDISLDESKTPEKINDQSKQSTNESAIDIETTEKKSEEQEIPSTPEKQNLVQEGETHDISQNEQQDSDDLKHDESNVESEPKVSFEGKSIPSTPYSKQDTTLNESVYRYISQMLKTESPKLFQRQVLPSTPVSEQKSVIEEANEDPNRTPVNVEASFTFADRVELLQTKLSYENQIVELQEKLELQDSAFKTIEKDLRDELTNTVEKMGMKIQDCEARYQEKVKLYDILSQQYYESQNENEKLKEAIMDMDSQRHELREMFQKVNSDLQNRITNLIIEKEQLQECQKKQLQEKSDESAMIELRLTKILEEKQNEMEQNEKSFNTKINELKSIKETEMEKLRNQFEATQNELKEFKIQSEETIKALTEDQEKKISILKEDLEKLRGENLRLLNLKSRSEQDRQALEDKLFVCEEQNLVLEGKLEQTGKQLIDSQSKIQTLTSKLSEQHDNLKNLKNDNEKLQQLVDRKEADLVELKIKFDDFSRSKEQTCKEILEEKNRLEARVEKLLGSTKRLADVETELFNVKKEKLDLESQLDKYQGYLREARTSLEDKELDLKRNEKQNQIYLEDLKEKQTKIQNLIQEQQTLKQAFDEFESKSKQNQQEFEYLKKNLEEQQEQERSKFEKRIENLISEQGDLVMKTKQIQMKYQKAKLLVQNAHQQITYYRDIADKLSQKVDKLIMKVEARKEPLDKDKVKEMLKLINDKFKLLVNSDDNKPIDAEPQENGEAEKVKTLQVQAAPVVKSSLKERAFKPIDVKDKGEELVDEIKNEIRNSADTKMGEKQSNQAKTPVSLNVTNKENVF